MDDLISRAAAIDAIVSGTIFETLEDLRKCAEKPGTNNGETWIGGANDAIYAIDSVNDVDAEPVVHSNWKTTDAFPHWLYCMNCYRKFVPNVQWIKEYNIPTNYCPNCGAKMDGEAKA